MVNGQVGLGKGDPSDKETIRRFAEEAEQADGPEWEWVRCGQKDCNVCTALREEYPDREAYK